MKTVLITGSSSKICQSAIKKFLDNGYKVITTYYKNKINIANVTTEENWYGNAKVISSDGLLIYE